MRRTEVSGRLVASPAFKAGGTGDPRPAGSIPVHLRRGVAEAALWTGGASVPGAPVPVHTDRQDQP